MAVTSDNLADYLGISSPTTEQTAELQNLLDAASALVEAEATKAPDAIKDLATRRFAAYQFDQPWAARGQSYTNAMVNSGASSLLARWVVRRLVGGE